MVKEKFGNLREKEESSGKSRGIFYRLYQVTQKFCQLDDLSFYQNAVSRSPGKLSEIREKSGKSQGKCKSKKVVTLSEVNGTLVGK